MLSKRVHAFAELSKFVSCPGVVHLKAARRVLSYLSAGTVDEGITYSRPTHDRHVNCLFGWVDSDYAADPDTRRSVRAMSSPSTTAR